MWVVTVCSDSSIGLVTGQSWLVLREKSRQQREHRGSRCQQRRCNWSGERRGRGRRERERRVCRGVRKGSMNMERPSFFDLSFSIKRFFSQYFWRDISPRRIYENDQKEDNDDEEEEEIKTGFRPMCGRLDRCFRLLSTYPCHLPFKRICERRAGDGGVVKPSLH